MKQPGTTQGRRTGAACSSAGTNGASSEAATPLRLIRRRRPSRSRRGSRIGGLRGSRRGRTPRGCADSSRRRQRVLLADSWSIGVLVGVPGVIILLLIGAALIYFGVTSNDYD